MPILSAFISIFFNMADAPASLLVYRHNFYLLKPPKSVIFHDLEADFSYIRQTMSLETSA